MTPRLAGWTLTALVALAVAGGVYWIPIQVSDSLEILERVDELPSVSAAFAEGLHSSRTMLRPMRQVQTKLLLQTAHEAGDRFNPVFRSYHALGAALLVLLFGALAGPRNWVEVAALAFALTVLTGLHTFAGMMREAYPVNHFLLIGIASLAMVALTRSRGGWLLDALAVLIFVLAMLTLESGILVWVIGVAGYVAGLRGMSKRALILMTALLAAYLVVRIGFLDMTGNALGERQTGFGVRMLSAKEQEAQFGDRPLLLYAYTVVCSVLTIPLSQPVAGQWTAVRDYLDGQLVRVHTIEIGTSLAATLLIVWYLAGRETPTGPRRYRQPLPMVMLAVLIASAVLSYSYAKSEIMSTAGALYALAAYMAAAEALPLLSRKLPGTYLLPVLALTIVVSIGWSFRAMGLQYKLQRSAHAARNEWVLRMPPYASSPARATSEHLTPVLRDQALAWGRANPFMLSRRAQVYWGQD